MRTNIALVLFLVIAAAPCAISSSSLLANGRSPVLVQAQSISVESPKNNVVYVDSVPLVFTVAPLAYPGPYPYTNLGQNYVGRGGSSYSLDGQANITIAGNTNLTGLANGTHTIKVFQSWTYYNDYFMGGVGPQPYGVTYSAPVSFTFLNTVPAVSNLSVENSTYYTECIALNFTVSEPLASASYSLDNQSNVTIQGNTTITGLTLGSHNLTVYATDEVGNTGVSETIYFSVAEEPQPEPFPTVPVAAASVAAVAVVGTGLLVYFRKRKR